MAELVAERVGTNARGATIFSLTVGGKNEAITFINFGVLGPSRGGQSGNFSSIPGRFH